VKLTVGQKLTTGFAAMMLVVLALAFSSLYSTGSVASELAASTGTPVKLFLAGSMKAAANNLRSNQRGAIMYSLENDKEHAEATREDYLKNQQEMAAMIAGVKPLLTTEKSKTLIKNLESYVGEYNSYFQQLSALCSAGKAKGAFLLYRDKVSPIGAAMEKSAGDMMELEKQLMAESAAVGEEKVSGARWIGIVLSAVALAVVMLALLVVRGITQSLRNVTDDLAEGAAQIASAAAQVSSSSQSLSQGASEQAASLEETSASAEEVTSMTRKNAENSRSAAELMTKVDQRVSDGNRTLDQMVTSMTEITSSSDKISKIIKVIDEIAFQTNILALNAAVEAARAGEAGMGFAVVADEVRNLAQRSAQAAKDTAALIEDSISKSNEGGARLQQVAQVIHSITESSAKVKTLVDEVNIGSQEQARVTEEIAKALAQMDQVTQSTAANAEESASASEEMSAQAQSLNQIIEQLQTMVGGSARVKTGPVGIKALKT
jgi:methyl-accepting chemotaxis protein